MASITETFTNTETGEVKTVRYQKKHIKYAKRGGVKMYTDIALVAIAGLSQKEAKIFHYMIMNRDSNNIVKYSMTKIAKDNDVNGTRQYLSKVLKKMRDLNLVQKIKNKIWINPLLVAPPYDNEDFENAYYLQKLWTYIFEDKNIYFEHRDQMLWDIFKIDNTSDYMTIGKKDNEKTIKLPEKR